MTSASPGRLPGTHGVATARNLGRYLAAIWDVRVSSAHLVPGSGAVILVANHTGALDGPLLAAVSPRPVHVLAKSQVFVPPWGSLLRSLGQVPVENRGPDRSALLVCRELLADRRVVGVFPEASRGRGDLRHSKHGAAYLAATSRAPIVPVAVLGSRRSGAALDSLPRPRTRIDVMFGEPFTVAADAEPHARAALARVGENIRQQLADHVEVACRRTGQRLPDLPAVRGRS
jgi:1-acyl-sn-glycerol-3-phosphate acyltransferase